MASTVKAIPEGYHTITPSITVRGGNEAIEFYKKAFGAEERARMPAQDGKRLMHAEIKIGDSIVMLADEFPEWGGMGGPLAIGGSPVTLHLYVDDVDRVWERAIAAGAKVTMPLADMFWGDRYGQLQDPFGHKWSLATHKEDLTPEQMRERMQAEMSKPAS